MGLIARQSLKSSIGFYLGVLIGAINTLFISTHFLSPDQLSISRILLENSLIFAAFAHLSAPSISDRFLPSFRESASQKNAFFTWLLVLPVIGLIGFIALYWLFAGHIQGYYRQKSPSLVPYLWLSVPMTVAWVYISVLEAYSRGIGRTAIPTFFREVIFRGLNVLLIVLFGVGWVNFNGFLYLSAGLMFLMVLLLGLYLKRLDKSLQLSFAWAQWSRSQLAEFLRYGFIIVLGSVGVNLILFVDRNVIANQIGTEAAAIFIIASYIASIIEIPSKAIRQITGPILSGAITQKDAAQVKNLYQKSAQNLLLVGGILFVLITVSIADLLAILPKSQVYSQGVWIVIIVGFAKLVDMSLGMNNEMIAFSPYYRYNTYLYLVLTVLAVGLNYWLIPYFGVNGSAAATALITIISAVLRFGLVYRTYGIQPFGASNWRIIASLGLVLAIGLLIPAFGSSFISKMASIAARSLAVMATLLLINRFFPLSEDIQALLSKFSKR